MSHLPFFKNNEFFSEPVRLLVRESHAIFATVPRDDSEMTKTDAIAISRRYRSIVHECVENLSRIRLTDHSRQIKIFKELEVIWNLCEILLLDVSQAGTLIIHLRNWIKMHFEELDPSSRKILQLLDDGTYRLQESGAEEEVFWNLILKLVMRGETKKAIQLLSCHYEFQRSDQMQLVASMLDSMPLSNQYIVHEFCNKWTTWSSWCRRERATGQFDSNPHLLNIVRLLSQDNKVYEELAESCESWYQLMVAYLMYSDPCIRETDLSELCRKMIETFKRNHPRYCGGFSEPDLFDEIIISAFEYDLTGVIANCCAHLEDNWWFVTHFIDLLHCSNQLHLHDITESDKLRETFLQDYATTLFDDNILWPVGVSYLDSCRASGTLFLELLLSRIPLSVDDEIKAHKIVSIANSRGLSGIPKSVCLLMARLWLAKTMRLEQKITSEKQKQQRLTSNKLPSAINLSNALYWAIRSGDTPMITYVSDQYLHYYCKTGTFPDNHIFDSLRMSPLDNERLAFLAKYYEFRQILHESHEDLSEAASLLMALLASKVYPRFFCQELLNDSKHLLDLRHQLIFKPEKTLDLMHSIEEISKENVIAPEDMPNEDTELRQKLVRNMARSLISSSGEDK